MTEDSAGTLITTQKYLYSFLYRGFNGLDAVLFDGHEARGISTFAEK